MYAWLDSPGLYRLAQRVLGAGGEAIIADTLMQMLPARADAMMALDVGCGPSSLLRRIGLDPIGLDLTPSYLRSFAGSRCVQATACTLPFADATFDLVWSCGLLHHLPESDACRAVQEMNRVRRPRGRVVICDAVLPRSPWTRPLAYGIRSLDRGRWMRTHEGLEALLRRIAPRWRCQRMTYAPTGLECLIAMAD